MKRPLLLSILFAALFVLVQIMAPASSAQAAPGDFLRQWGAQYHFSPYGVARDQSGNIYITEYYPDTGVEVYDSTGKLLRRWGSYGTGDGQFTYPGGIAVAANGTVYVTDLGNNRIEYFDNAGNFLGKWGSAGTGDGQFGTSGAIALDALGNVYVTDTDNDRVQVFDGTGVFLRKWGTTGSNNGEFQLPQGIVLDSAGNVYVADNANARVQVFDSAGTFLRTWGSYGTLDGQFNAPGALAVDALGRILVGDDILANVQVFDSAGNFLFKFGTFGDASGQFLDPTGIAIQSNGEIAVADTGNDRIQFFSSTGTFLRKWWSRGSGPGEFDSPAGTAVDGAGNVYVTDYNNHRVQVFSGTGTFLRQWGSNGTADGQFSYPEGVALDALGNVYVTEKYGNRVQVFDTTGKFLRGWGGTSMYAPSGVAVDAGGNVYVADSGNARVEVYDSTGALLRQWGPPADTHLAIPYGIALDAAGNVYVADSGNLRVEVYDSQGNFLRSIGDGVFAAAPRWVAVDPGGNVLVSDPQNNQIVVFDSKGTLRTKWGGTGAGAGLFNNLWGISIDPTGLRITAADMGNNRIQVLEGFGTPLPNGWSTGDVGSVGLAGRAGFLNGVFTVQGAGADIWGTVDGFRYVYQPLSGDGQIVARVASIQNTNGYAKAGVMIRESLAANSAHAMMVLTPSNGAEFSRRTGTGATTAVSSTAGIVAPYWVKVARTGNTLTGYISRDGTTWVVVNSAAITMANTVYLGLAVTSHNTSVLCTATFDHVTLGGQVNVPTVTLTAPANGATFNAPATIAISATATPGTGAAVKQVDFYAGSTLIGSAVAAPYSFSWSNVPVGSYTLTAQVIDTLGAAATSAPVTISVGSTVLPSPWSTSDVGSVGLAGSASFANGLFTLKGAGADIYGSADAFRYVYQTLSGDGQIVARVVSVQNTNSYAKGGVMIRESLAANARHASMVLTPVNGAEFSRRTTTGGSTAVASMAGSAPYWVKVVRKGTAFSGYISRDGITWTLVGSSTITMASTVYVGLVDTSHNTGALCTSTIDGVSVTTPGNPPTVAITAPSSGATYTAPATIPISAGATPATGATITKVDFYAGTTLIGTATASPYTFTWSNVPAGSYSLTAVATDSLGVAGTSAAVPVTVTTPAGQWTSQDIGTVGLTGNATVANGLFTVSGAGADIYGTADGFRYVLQPLNGDGQIVARVISVQNTNAYAKAGVMIRESLAANAPHAMMAFTPSNGAEFSRRTTTGGSTTVSSSYGVAAPYWVKVVRLGSAFTGYISRDGITWTMVGSTTITMNTSAYIGLIVTSHNTGVLCTATFDSVAIQ